VIDFSVAHKSYIDFNLAFKTVYSSSPPLGQPLWLRISQDERYL
jgi:hypothetical protein